MWFTDEVSNCGSLTLQENPAQHAQDCSRLPFTFLAVFAFVFRLPQAQQPATPATSRITFASHYTKYEFRIPMRDGKRLFTAVYVPKDMKQAVRIRS